MNKHSTRNNDESGTSDVWEALFLMSQNPPYKFVRIETIQMANYSPQYYRLIFEGENIVEAQIRYLQNDYNNKNKYRNIDLSQLKVLAVEIERSMKSREDHCI